MKIKKISLQNIKSFCEQQTAEFNDRLNFIIGSNGSGKSNLLEILQSCINDIFLVHPVTFTDDNQKLYRVEPRSIQQVNIEKQIFTPHYFKNQLDQLVNIEIEIEEEDIKNFISFKEVTSKILDFEKASTNSSLFSDALSQFNLNDDYSDLAGKASILTFKGIHLELNTIDERMVSFINYLRYSRLFFNYINFFNSSRDDDSITEYFQIFYYFSPNRESLDISNVQTIDLHNSQSRSSNQLFQYEVSQNSRFSSSEGLLQRLAENHFLRNKANEVFRKLIIKHLNINFAIYKIGTKYQPKYSISFFRNEPGRQIPVRFSSGEKELFNFVASIYLHDIRSGFILIDEPEIHLHPKWQRKLQDLLSVLAENGNNQIISVTHSDHFVRSDLLQSLIIVHKDNDESKIVVPDLLKLNLQKNKDLILLLQSSNNTKVFFSDKVVLVEGIADKIIFQALIDSKQKYSSNSEVIEIIDVSGKNNFSKYSSFLETWKIPHFVIADLDYLSQIGLDHIKEMFKGDNKKIKKKLNEKGSKDAVRFLKITDDLKAKKIVQKSDLADLFNFSDSIKLKNTGISKDDYSKNKNLIHNFINEKYTQNLFILKKGVIEDYFKVSKFSIESAVAIATRINNKDILISKELKEIVSMIFKK